MTRLSRFLHLERDRPASRPDESAGDASGAAAPPSPGADAHLPDPQTRDNAHASPSRFGTVEPPRPRASEPPSASTAPGHLARFDKPDDSNVTLDEKNAADQPFVRCMRCEGDNTRYARHCVHCHGSLDTPEQRAFNEKLWAERRALRDQEREAHAAAQKAQFDAAYEAAAEQRKAHEELARKVARETKQKLGESSFLALFGIHRRGRAWVYEAGVYLAITTVLVAVLGWLGGWAILRWTAPVIIVAGALLALRARLLK